MNNVELSKLINEIDILTENNDELRNKLTNYMTKLPIANDEEKILNVLKTLSKYEDIFKEFCSWILSGKIIKNEKSITESGFTVYDILSKEPSLYTYTAFLWLVYLRENNENIIKNLKDGIPANNITKLSYNVGRIKEYLNEKGLSDVVIKQLTKNYYDNPDIANEFEFWIRTKKFIENNPVIESGYTAKKLFDEFNDKLNISGIFSMLITLRNHPEKGLKYIDDNFSTK